MKLGFNSYLQKYISCNPIQYEKGNNTYPQVKSVIQNFIHTALDNHKAIDATTITSILDSSVRSHIYHSDEQGLTK